MSDRDFEITIPRREPTTPLDEAIRAFDEGDGATIQALRGDVLAWLRELRRYRAAIRCTQCGGGIIGREPVCGTCHASKGRSAP